MRGVAFGTLALTAAALLAGPALAQEHLNLVCYGEGEKPTAETHGGYEWDHKQDRYRYRNETTLGTKSFDTALTVQVSGDDGRIQLPKRLVPPLNSGGEGEGWWPLRDVMVTPDQVTASYRLNGMNQPKVRIDRRTGRISVKGIEEFHGTCDAVDEGERRF